MLHKYEDQIFLYIDTKTQPAIMSTAHAITKYVPEAFIQIVNIYAISAKNLICIYNRGIEIYMPHMKSMVPTIQKRSTATFQI